MINDGRVYIVLSSVLRVAAVIRDMKVKDLGIATYSWLGGRGPHIAGNSNFIHILISSQTRVLPSILANSCDEYCCMKVG